MRDVVLAVVAVFSMIATVMVAGPAIAMALVVGIWLLALAWRKPLVSAYMWWAAVAIVPTWIGIGVADSQFVLGSVIALALVPGVMAAAGPRVHINALDWAMLVLISLMIVSFLFGASRGLASDAVFQWGLPYLLMRLVSLRTPADSLGRMILRVGLLCAIWAIIEFAFDVHVFETVQLPGSLPNLQEVWQSIQTRGGIPRSETSFGTSIALSGFLALAIPYALQLRVPWLLVSVAVLGGGMLATLARTGAVAAAIVIGLTLLLGAQRYRIPLTLAFVTGVVLVAPIVTGQNVEGTVASDFASSNGYRDYVFSSAIPQSNWFGPADLTFGAYISVDNAYLRLALESGRVPALALLLVFVVALFAYLRYRQGLALTASIAMGASIYAVALITQWQMFIFAMLGIAATEMQRAIEAKRAGEATVARRPAHTDLQMVAPGSTQSKRKPAIRRRPSRDGCTEPLADHIPAACATSRAP